LNRSSLLICKIALLVCPQALMAQRGVHGAGSGQPPSGASNPAPNNDINDFNRAVALQATPDQVARFRQLTKSVETARKESRNLIQHAENGDRADSSGYAGLNNAVDETQSNCQRFLGSFSTSQQSGLKPLTKKLSKADSEVAKQSKALTQDLGQSQIDSTKIGNVVEKLNEALSSLQTEQLEIGKEMGIQLEEHSE
jgi:hypothetical protein